MSEVIELIKTINTEIERTAKVLFDKAYNEALELKNENKFKESYDKLENIVKILPNKSEELSELISQWEEEEKEYWVKLKAEISKNIVKNQYHEPSKTSFYKAIGTPESIYVGKFYFYAGASNVEGRDKSLTLRTYFGGKTAINVNKMEIFVDGEECEIGTLNLSFETEVYSIDVNETAHKFVTSDSEIEAVKKIGNAKEAKIIFSGDNGKREFILSDAQKKRIIQIVDYYEIVLED